MRTAKKTKLTKKPKIIDFELHIGLERGESLAQKLRDIVEYANGARLRLEEGDLTCGTLDDLNCMLNDVEEIRDTVEELDAEFSREFKAQS